MEATKLEEIKKYGLFGVIGVTVILAIIGTFVPDARDYLGNIVKVVLAVVPGFAN